MISAKNLTKHFTSERLALDDVNFEVKPQEIVGLLGHNGAGKSTVLGIMLGMVRPDSGEVLIDGVSVQRNRASALRKIGAIFEAPSFYDYMSGWQNLRTLCAMSGWWEEKEVWRVLELVNLKDRIHGKVGTYSHGMRQRLALAQALLPEPQCLLLDEPTDGLDPEGIHEFRETVLKLRREHGMTILLNSHLLSEVEQMCDRCVILRNGIKVYEGPVGGTQDQFSRYAIKTPDQEKAAQIAQQNGAQVVNGVVILPKDLEGHEFLARMVRAEVRVDSWAPEVKTLEEWYMEFTLPKILLPQTSLTQEMRLLLTQWRAEMWKLMARKRTYLGFGAFFVLEIVIYFLLSQDFGNRWLRTMIQRGGESFSQYFSGLTVGYVVLRLAIVLLGGIYLTLVAGDVLAKESEDGNLRLILARPISRLRLLGIKFVSCLVYTVVLIQFIAWSALVLGVILRGWGGGLCAFAPEQEFMAFYDAWEGPWRYALASITLSISMMAATFLAFFFSCWRIKPAAATITALSYLFIDMILREAHLVEGHKYLLLTHYMSTWSMVFFEQIQWFIILKNYAILFGVGLTLFVFGALVFESRDIKS